MRIRRVCFTLFVSVVILLFSVFPVNADTGPKPSVVVNFELPDNEECYATLLSATEQLGPASAWDGTEEGAYYDESEYEIWKAFVDFEDTDGYFFVQCLWRIDESKNLSWTYFPPSSFKILVYFPQSNSFAVSGIYERYAFHSYFTVDMRDIETGTAEETDITAEITHVYKSYDYTQEILSLFARIVITVIIESAVALLFGYRGRRQFGIVLAVNTATQILLNVLLNIVNYHSGALALVLAYIVFELLVIVTEALIFSRLLTTEDVRKRACLRAVIYSVTANVCSFILGLVIAQVMPGMF